jgi:predicted HAD superfamily Cof-like phosphohydrolase
MNKHLKMVRDFHDAFGFKQANEPTELTLKERIMRSSLISEEFSEILRAVAAEDKVKALDGLVDLSYFTLGTLAMEGKDVEKIDHEYLNESCFEDMRSSFVTLSCMYSYATEYMSDSKDISSYLSSLYHACVLAAQYWLDADFDLAFEIVQESNMSKLGEDGKPIYDAAGKIRKGPNFKEPDLSQCFVKGTNWLN